jgi:hypothetical protein
MLCTKVKSVYPKHHTKHIHKLHAPNADISIKKKGRKSFLTEGNKQDGQLYV